MHLTQVPKLHALANDMNKFLGSRNGIFFFFKKKKKKKKKNYGENLKLGPKKIGLYLRYIPHVIRHLWRMLSFFLLPHTKRGLIFLCSSRIHTEPRAAPPPAYYQQYCAQIFHHNI